MTVNLANNLEKVCVSNKFANIETRVQVTANLSVRVNIPLLTSVNCVKGIKFSGIFERTVCCFAF